MGLKERRAITNFEETIYPKLVDGLKAAAGFELEVEVDWTSIAEEGMDHLYDDAIPMIFFAPIEAAIKGICIDDMGREALQESLKKIVLRNVDGNFSPQSCFNFEGGVLTMDHKTTSNIEDVDKRSAYLQEMLENNI